MSRALTAGGTLVLYAALVGWLTWPLAAHLGTHLPATHPACRFDTLYAAWVLAHESRALVTAPARMAHANNFHPAPFTLFYGETGFGALPYFFPTFVLSGNPTLAVNLLFLGGLVLTAASLHWVVRRWTGSHLAGLVSAGAFLCNRWLLRDFVPSAPCYAVLLYFPLIIWLASSPAARPGRYAVLYLLVVLQCLVNVVYVASAVLVPLGLLALGRLARSRSRRPGLALLAVVGLAVLTLLPVYGAHLAVREANPGLAQQTLWRTPWDRTQMPWGPLGSGPAAVPGAVLFLILLGVACRVGGSAAAPRLAWLHAGLWAVAGLVISVTPIATWSGRPVRLPQQLIATWLPLYQVVRRPERLGVAALAGLSLLAGLAFAECRRLLGRLPPSGARAAEAALAVALIALMAAGLQAPYPISPAIDPDATIVRILKDPGGPLLELPVGLSAVEKGPAALLAPEPHARAMYRSIYHGRALLNGYSGYWPAGFEERMALARRLPDPAALALLARDTGLEMILVHLDDFGRAERRLCQGLERLPPALAAWCARDFGGAERSEWLALAAGTPRSDLRLVAREGQDLLFRVVGGP